MCPSDAATGVVRMRPLFPWDVEPPGTRGEIAVPMGETMQLSPLIMPPVLSSHSFVGGSNGAGIQHDGHAGFFHLLSGKIGGASV